MSIAEPLPPAAKKLQPYRKWYMLFPENWVELAFNQEWRRKRLKELASNQSTGNVGLGLISGPWLLMLVLLTISNFVEKDGVQSRLTLLILFVSITVLLGVQFLNALKLQFARMQFQMIDCLESESADHD